MNRLERPIMGYHGSKWRTEVLWISLNAQSTASPLSLAMRNIPVHDKEKQDALTTA